MYDILLVISHFLTSFKRYFVYFATRFEDFLHINDKEQPWSYEISTLDFKHRNLHLAQRIMNDLTNTNFF